ncbi:MAG: XRE family transcriptional regulator [Sulfuritalea sp.]|nr:XRE family transcriptional regulator [Sulfuritalea sp.]
MSQSEFAQIGGVGRLAQLQYEGEVTAPTTRYLSLIASAGVDLSFLVLGMHFSEGRLTAAQEERVNEKTIDWIDAYAETQPDGRISTDTRKALDRVIRNLLRQIERGELPADFDAMALIVNQASGSGRSRS